MQLLLVFLCALCASAVNFFDFFFVSLRALRGLGFYFRHFHLSFFTLLPDCYTHKLLKNQRPLLCCAFNNTAAQCQKSDKVGKCHGGIQDIRKVPDELNLDRCAQRNEEAVNQPVR